MADTTIEWTEKTWNPVTGCSKISAGCLNCYAERMTKRLKAMGQKNYQKGFEVACHEDALDKPLGWKKPSMIFVNSMSDLFHEEVPLSFIKKVFKIMNKAKWHTFQVLTKRADRLVELAPELNWTENIWMGVTVENDKNLERIEMLKKTPAKLKFLSLEPLLSSLSKANFEGIDWVIVGGESGPGARPIEEKWVLEIQKKCKSDSIPFFFKQWGGVNKKKAGKLLQGKICQEMPKL